MSKQPNAILKVFLSYKKKDKIAARRLKTELEVLGCGRIEVFIAERISSGETWPGSVHKMLRDADWLILLYTDPTDDWDWCMYETGYFSACELELSHRRLVCLLPADCPVPNPLALRKSVAATEQDIEDFLHDLLLKPLWEGAEPIYPRLFTDSDLEKELHQRIKNILLLVIPNTENVKESLYVVPHLQLTIPQNGIKNAQKGNIVSDSKVQLNAAAAKQVFFALEKELTWENFLALLSSDQDSKIWGKGLVKSVSGSVSLFARFAANMPTLPLLRPKKSAYVYLAVLYQREKLMNGSQRFQVAFTATLPDDKFDSELISDRVFNALLLIRRFRWQVIDQFKEHIHNASISKSEQQLQCMNDMINTVDGIAHDARMRNLFAGSQVTELFKDSAISTNDVNSAIVVLRKAFQEIKDCILNFSGSDAKISWETFQERVKCMAQACNFLLGSLAMRFSELNPPQPVPTSSE